jgi:hypothetical protein
MDPIEYDVGPLHMQTIQLSKAGHLQRFFISAASWERILAEVKASLFDKTLAFLRR